MRVIDATTSWWEYDGPLAVVFSGLAAGPLILPVRLPTAPSNQACLDHHLADPSKWHKIDLVRRPDPNADGGWRYEAHLMVLVAPYVSPRVEHARAVAALATMDRRAGIDVNVSNITVASHANGSDLRITRVSRDASQENADRRRSRRERQRLRALERSRRASNRAQYQLSKRQEKRARRRAAAGLPAQDVIPAGPRKMRSDSKPMQSYRHDQLTASYRRIQLTHAAEATAGAQARRDHAPHDLVREHGPALVVEDCAIRAWSQSWGRALAAFSPATLMSAIEREATVVAKVAGGSARLLRASTRTTAMSQHCPCGARVPKSLTDRVHRCPECGLRGDRDAVAAVLASFTHFDDPTQASSAAVDYDAMQRVLGTLQQQLASTAPGWQGTRSESTSLSAREGSFLAWLGWTPDLVVVARRTAGSAPCSTPNETGFGQTTSERARARTHMSTYALLGNIRDKP